MRQRCLERPKICFGSDFHLTLQNQNQFLLVQCMRTTSMSLTSTWRQSATDRTSRTGRLCSRGEQTKLWVTTVNQNSNVWVILLKSMMKITILSYLPGDKIYILSLNHSLSSFSFSYIVSYSSIDCFALFEWVKAIKVIFFYLLLCLRYLSISYLNYSIAIL